MIRLLSAVTAVVLLLSPAVAAAQTPPQAPTQAPAVDLTGKWAGTFVMTVDGVTGDDAAYMVLKQTGQELAGTAGPSVERQWQIIKGKVDGTKVTFDVKTEGAIIAFDLTLVEGHLKGTAKAEQDGRSMSAVVDVQRKVN